MGPAGLRVYRIGSGRHPVFQGEGARLHGARWNAKGRAVIYCGGSFAIAMLERLVYAAIGTVPADDRFVAADLPDALIERLDEETVADWRRDQSRTAREAGDRWLDQARSVALSVPSAVTGIDRNLLLNPSHPAFGEVQVGREQPVDWDGRLFRRAIAVT